MPSLIIPPPQHLFDRTLRILRDQWDPIGLGADGPDDEYDSYVGRIALLVWNGGTIETIASELERIETVTIGMPGNPERDREVATALLNVAQSLGRGAKC